MTDFLLELRSEEIPARMQARAREDLARLFTAELAKAGLSAGEVVTYSTPRRLALIARDLPDATEAVREETKGPRASAPPQALEGFLRKTGLTREALVERNGVLFAVVNKPGRATADVLAEAIPAIIRAFPWPKSMRWGEASRSTESLRWVRPLHGIVALLGEAIVPVEIATVTSSAATLGHRFHHPGAITLGGAHDYVEKLRACHVLVDQAEREALIRDGAFSLAEGAGFELVPDEGLVVENAGLTEWPVPLLGRFDEAFLAVPPEVIQLTARVNQKYFVCRTPPRNGEGDHAQHGGGVPRDGALANAFICTANIDAADGGDRIVEGNRKVLAARLSDARFFYEQDLKVPLEQQAKKLDRIVFHEKLGTVADKVERVAKLARWLVEEGIISSPQRGEGDRSAQPSGGGGAAQGAAPVATAPPPPASPAVPLPVNGEDREELATLAERAARLCKADLVTGMVGEFPELQGVMGGHYARAQGEDSRVADAIRDHYKPVGQGDEVPTAPVTVAVSLADKLDTLFGFFAIGLQPTGSSDPFAIRRSALGIIRLLIVNQVRLPFVRLITDQSTLESLGRILIIGMKAKILSDVSSAQRLGINVQDLQEKDAAERYYQDAGGQDRVQELLVGAIQSIPFLADRLKVQQREAGVRHDLIDAVFALGGEDDLVRLLARVRALQAFVGTEDGANLLVGYKRAANILKREGYAGSTPDRHPGLEPGSTSPQDQPSRGHVSPPEQLGDDNPLSYTPEKDEAALIAALESAEPAAASAVAAEDFERAMAALASLRAPIDAFFDTVTVNDPDPARREARLRLLARVRTAVHTVADFSRIEG